MANILTVAEDAILTPVEAAAIVQSHTVTPRTYWGDAVNLIEEGGVDAVITTEMLRCGNVEGGVSAVNNVVEAARKAGIKIAVISTIKPDLVKLADEEVPVVEMPLAGVNTDRFRDFVGEVLGSILD